MVLGANSSICTLIPNTFIILTLVPHTNFPILEQRKYPRPLSQCQKTLWPSMAARVEGHNSRWTPNFATEQWSGCIIRDTTNIRLAYCAAYTVTLIPTEASSVCLPSRRKERESVLLYARTYPSFEKRFIVRDEDETTSYDSRSPTIAVHVGSWCLRQVRLQHFDHG